MSELQREVFFDGRVVPASRQDIWGLVHNSKITKIIVSPEQRQEDHFPQKTELVTEVKHKDDLNQVPSGEYVFSSDQSLLEEAKEQGYQTCVYMEVNDKEALEQSWKDAIKFDYAAVDFDLPTNIPLELIIAKLQERNTVLLRKSLSFNDVELALGCLETGSDGVMFSSDNLQEVMKLVDFLSQEMVDQLELHPLKVTEVTHVGMGVRGCIDTTDIMTQDEGMLVGSTSSGGIFVCSETHYLPYMNLRPFRVNAGAIHSYVWMPNDTSEYISDLAVGSKVLCVNTKGETRELTVGRIKKEVRPLLLIKGEVEGTELNVIVQDDWHIRVMGADGKPRNANKVKPGDELLAYVCEPGRHVGIKVNETITEV
ncbi:3-dehydroquinate synthase II [Aquisalibacillus elongatus]|uniref:3-dehydroquinate synthase II n=1 Tax=Aquisalibacillus elongatus TaxID=485577 RepID=A0A3N5B7X3_9BACI|nr:3-dehydroquinate synthase II [Aquisalibacillus elongatus]RPF53433.1 3-dehydroquinate synthase II [Aquisalibacillus elongatus]